MLHYYCSRRQESTAGNQKRKMNTTQSYINHLLLSPAAEREGGHLVLGKEAIDASTNAVIHCGWLWSDKSQAADMDDTRFGTRCVFGGKWATALRNLRAMPESQAREILATRIDTDRGPIAIADLMVDRYRAIYMTDAKKVRVLDFDKHDENDIGETKLVRRYTRRAEEKILEITAL